VGGGGVDHVQQTTVLPTHTILQGEGLLLASKGVNKPQKLVPVLGVEQLAVTPLAQLLDLSGGIAQHIAKAGADLV
jgi:hypothetical protein